jgi:hypothetical protein
MDRITPKLPIITVTRKTTIQQYIVVINRYTFIRYLLKSNYDPGGFVKIFTAINLYFMVL